MLGIAVYPGMAHTAAENLAYITRAYEYGFRVLFTSLHIPETDAGRIREDVAHIARYARNLGMEVVADISPRGFQALGATPADLSPLARLGLTGLRLDFGYDPGAIAAMTHNREGLSVIVNASTTTETVLEQILAAGGRAERLQGWHNFYPRPETGLSYLLFGERSRAFKMRGLAVAAFIPSLANPRGPIGKGLPTVEKHRSMPPALAAQHLLASGCVDTVLFGDPHAAEQELAAVAALPPDAIVLEMTCAGGPTATEREIAFALEHVNRLDAAALVIRSETSRSYASRGESITPRNTVTRPPYTVTIDNINYQRYTGELQITLAPLPADTAVNVVGHISQAYQFLVLLIGPGRKFILKERS